MQLPDAPYGYGSFGSYVPNNVVPMEVKRACIELALQTASGDLNPVLERKTLSEKVGPIEVSYDPASPQTKLFRNVEMMLRPFFTGSSISAGLVRT